MPQYVRDFTFPSATGTCDIFCRLWIPEKVRCVVQIAHGMAEHIGRYDDFAKFLNDNGVLVAANDHAGHGKSVKDSNGLGSFAPENGWSLVLEDMRALYKAVKQNYPDVPYILMGHSMGSFLARTFASRKMADVEAYIFSGTAGRNPAIGVARIIAKREIKKYGRMRPSRMLMDLSFGSYNKRFKPQRTGYEWLSRDTKTADLYSEDPLCGFDFTAGAFSDLFDGLSEIGAKEWAAAVPDVPVLLISGAEDPVGGFGKGVREVYADLRSTGHDVSMKLYEGGRHEMLNETNKDEVYRDILAFIDGAAEKRGGTK